MDKRKNFYQLLEVNIDAQIGQIRANYRKLAKQLHPDLNPANPQAADQFRNLQEAYETLSDSEKRRAYDASLHISHNKPRSSDDDNLEDWFGFTASATPTEENPKVTRRHMSKASQPRQAYLRHSIELTLQELFKGAKRNLMVAQTHTCGRCRGSGVLPGNGQKCPRCDGYGFLLTYEFVEVTIPPGVMPEMSIRVEMSHWGQDARHPLHMSYATGFNVMIHLRPDSLYQIEGRDLYAKAEVPATLLEAGGDWTLPAPEGGELTFKIPPQTLNGTVLKLRRQGLRSGAALRRGNLFCTLLAQPKTV